MWPSVGFAAVRRLLALSSTLLLLLFAVAGCGDDDDDDGGAGETAAEQTQTQVETQPERETRKPGECVEVAQPEPKPDGGEERPTDILTGDYTVTFTTNCGSFSVDVDEDGGLTSASFVQLADSGFYKNTFFHRIAPGFVIQGGDPTGTGVGGPGYTTRDEPPPDATYPKYTVAMAKSGQEPPGTAASQFFVMTGDGGIPTPDYAIVGKVTAGKKVIDAVGVLGDPSERPTQVVKVEKVAVRGG
jgi:peptidyl-prolyl cis-trans isomerase B (cyclophilin B)